MRRYSDSLLTPMMVLALMGPAGCGGPGETNLSTQAADDPDKMKAAQAEAQAALARSRAAEAAKTRGRIHVEDR